MSASWRTWTESSRSKRVSAELPDPEFDPDPEQSPNPELGVPWLRRGLLFLAATVLAAGGVELWLRCCHPIGAQIYELDPVLLSRPIPGAHRIFVMTRHGGGKHIPMRINSLGMRGPEPAVVKRGLRLVVYGDSMVMADNVTLEDCYPVRLAAELEARLGRSVEGLNAGVTGWGPDQATLLLESGVDQLDADLVVLVLCANNDFGDLMRNKLFRLDATGQLERCQPTIGPELERSFAARRRRASRPALFRAWEEISIKRSFDGRSPSAGRELDLQVLAYLRMLREQYEDWVVERSEVVHSLFVDAYEADMAVQPESEPVLAKQALMEAVLRRFREQCQARGLPLFVLIVPSAVDLLPDFGVRVDPNLYPEYAPDRLSSTLARLAGEPVLDLYELFRATGPETLFVGGNDIHWNERGIALAAAASADRILAEGLVEP